MQKVEKFFDKVGDIVGYICMFVMALMIIDVFFNVVARYFFSYGNVAFQELEWHFFCCDIFAWYELCIKRRCTR